MNYETTTSDLSKIKADCLIVAVYENNKLSKAATNLDKLTNHALSKILKHGDIKGKIGESLLLHDLPNLSTARVLVIGCGIDNEIDELKAHKIFSHALEKLLKTNSKSAVNTLSELRVKNRDQSWVIQQLVLLTQTALYQFDDYKSQKKEAIKLATQIFTHENNKVSLKKSADAILHATAMSHGMNLVKDLANTPGNVCTPSYLAEQAKKLTKKYSSLNCSIIEEDEMKKLKMNALLAVTKGSYEKPKMIIVQYQGSKSKTSKPIVLIGKGITFDSGGISLKPGLAMDEMKYDMCGAASVLGTLQAVAELKLPINVVGILVCAENMPGGGAIKPGDIVTSHNGKTIEILNTDAEGRLVLCDALSYCKKFNPEVVIDIATLTGAVIVALGNIPTGLMANQQELADKLLNAGQEIFDRAWQLPLWEDYQPAMDSTIADIANISSIPGAGSITGASFLARFTKDYSWAHLDIAGTAWKSGKEKGATGRPVPLLTQYLINHSHK